MGVQELYQTFYEALVPHENEVRINEWWEWIADLYTGELTANAVGDLVERLKSGQPIQYVVNRAPFFNMNLYVNEDVLIPRPETEELVYYLLKANNTNVVSLLDIGTGSGCIPIQVKKERASWKVDACDISTEALAVAKKNTGEQNVDIDLFIADLFEPSSFQGRGKYDIITSNPPYIDRAEKEVMSSETRYEPDVALFAPNTSVEVYEALSVLLSDLLKPGGYFYFELNEFSAKEVLALYQRKGLHSYVLDDLQGKPRILAGRWSC